jgi:two-component system, NarL family, sensor histidine kinase DesK
MTLLSTATLGNDELRLAQGRRIILSLVVVVILLQPYLKIMQRGPQSAPQWFEVVGAPALACMAVWLISSAVARSQPAPWFALVPMLALSIGLLVIGGPGSLAATTVAAAMWGRNSRTALPATVAAAACALTGLLLAALKHYPSGSVFAVLVVAPLAAFFAFSATRRAETLDALRRTRAELARAAVDEERLRIARDLHDLLGHSLSLITLKAELAGRVIRTEPDRAAMEISELESVARQSLADVRGAVAGFRQPDLAGELVAARQLLDAAGIASDIISTDTAGLPQEVDSALAWAVREGATNVVRHSTATHVFITVSVDPAEAVVEIRDNGQPASSANGPLRASGSAPAELTAGPAGRASARPRPAFAGSGLTGLAERVRCLGGEIAAGAVGGHGFLLRVVVPLSAPS